MCVTCGCSDDSEVKMTNPQTGKTVLIETKEEQDRRSHTHTLPDGTVMTHSHSHVSEHQHSTSSPQTPFLHASIHGTTIKLEQDILRKNDLIAAQNRGWFKGRDILALNLVSSPGAGKTTLLVRTINDLKSQIPISVIEGDQETVNDAQKIKETGCRVVQINTGTGCHLDAAMVERGYTELDPPLHSLLAIENVGNLVCPALFDLGEKAKVAILSVTEGEDKPIKYPYMFRVSDAMILTKIDLLPYVQFDRDRCIEYARQVNPHIRIFQVSAVTGEGLEAWYTWLKSQLQEPSLIKSQAF
ncbi:hydrogenase nickel incorporation protein HypB [Candidatus Gracilibacteria bacterium]|nr:hydrogenase nickel incorporation protein HypB [Candidatus Gracilibacteria bacterium]NJM87163.1 hydrogenase nickel incorporation protein HypB [Hydrococcus sp. RU_2_2]NJP20057.1 hydrogenase nickel incorporation protein HypB [Hydrococcus sp. CRU_1_1]